MAESRHPETRDVRPRALLLFAAGLAAFLVASMGVLYLLFEPEAPWPQPGAAWSANEASPALSTSPYRDLAAVRRTEEAELGKLAWVDRARGIARIPIGEAMKLIAQNGLPRRPDQAASPTSGECALLATDVPRAPQARDCRDPDGGKP